ncbi:uncharacterized protein LOC144632146 [Oculina patagonica]
MSLGLLIATVSETTILCVICLAVLFGNLSLYIIVYKNKDLRTITNLYILNLAAADIMVSVLSIPFTMVTVITGRWLFGDTACAALGFFTSLSFIASVMSLGMIAINRYFYIVKWNTYTKTFSKKKALLYAAAVWAVSISLASPPLFGWAEYRFIPGKSYCFVYWPSNVYFMFFMFTVCFFGPLSVMAFSYYNILTFTKNLNRRVSVGRNNLTPPPQIHEPETEKETQNRNIPDSELDHNIADRPRVNRRDGSKLNLESKSQEFRVTPEETKMTNTFLLVVALFIICWAPFAIAMFFDVYYPSPLPRAVDIASLLLGYLNSMCNPILYGLRNSAFKQGFLNLYSRFLPKRFRPSNVTQLEMNENAPPCELEMSLGVLGTVSETIILCVISLAAVIGNLGLYIMVYKNKDLRTITNLYILNLAAADIMVSVLSIPFTVVTVITGRWLFGDTACVALGFFTMLSFIASVMSLGMIAINRYFYIVKWNTYKNNFSKKKALLYAATVWAVSISLASPPLFGWAEYRFIPGKSYCFVYWPSNVYFMYFMITVCFFGPLSVMAFSYYNILTFTKNLKKRLAVSRNNLTSPPQIHEPATERETQNRNIPDSELDHDIAERPSVNRPESKSQEFRVTPEETKTTNTFLLVVALFIICWAPFSITMFFDVYYSSPLPRAVDMASLLLGYLNSICNPILYGLRNSAFKQGFLNLYSRFLPERFRRSNVTQLEMNANVNPRDLEVENAVL